MSPRFALLSTLIALAPISLPAAFTLISNFETGTDGWAINNPPGDTTGFVLSTIVDPLDSGNSALYLDNVSADPFLSAYADVSLPNAIPQSSTAFTIFYRFLKPTNAVCSYAGVVYNQAQAGTPLNTGAAPARLQIKPDLSVRDGMGYGASTTVDTLTWYDVWLVLNNSASTYDVYIKGGSFGNQTLIADDFSFSRELGIYDTMDRLMIADLDLVYMERSDYVLYDDFYVDPDGMNLTQIPEPSAYAGLLALGGAAYVCARRRPRSGA